MDRLIKSAPSNQMELDLFKNEWSYEVPIPNTVTGQQVVERVPPSVRLARECFGPLDGFRVLELGPNECEITVGLSKEKIKEVISIECRSRTFLKCLVIKNILGLKNVRFLLGNFVEYLRNEKRRFDLCLACGVLYHMTNPVELIELVCNNCDRVVVASHYVNDNLIHYDKNKDDSNLPQANWNISDEKGADLEYKGLKVKYFRNNYVTKSYTAPFIMCGHGGVDDYSNILELNDIIRAFEHFGFEIVGDFFDDPDGPRGPHVLFAAKRKSVPSTVRRSKYWKAGRRIKRQIEKRVRFIGSKQKTETGKLFDN